MIWPRRHRARRRNARGFTLIEILIGLVITAMMMTALGGALNIMGQGWRRHTANLVRQDMILRGLAVLSRDVHSLQRLGLGPQRSSGGTLFEGARDGLVFVGYEPPFPDLPGLYFLRYRVEKDGNRARLVRERARFDPSVGDIRDIAFQDGVTLLEGTFEYAFDFAGSDLDWQATWSNEKEPPALVRLAISDPRTRQALIAPYVMRPRIDAGHACVRPGATGCTAALTTPPADDTGKAAKPDGNAADPGPQTRSGRPN